MFAGFINVLRVYQVNISAVIKISLSPQQSTAMAKIKRWWNRGRPLYPVFVLHGYAGCGKSVLIRHVLSDIGLEGHTEENPGVLTGTFTGKAALVLQRMGVPARTIHSLIYRYIDPAEEDIDRLEAQIAEAELRARHFDGEARRIAEYNLAAMRKMLAGLMEPQFILDHAGSEMGRCRLVVLDEVSMVGEKMAKDILSFGTPLLVVGDPGQLPPVKDGEGYFARMEPDVMLTEIHRQARESPILRLATMAREGRHIPFGKHGECVAKVRRRAVSPEALLRADQVLCGRNDTRRRLNNDMRRASGIADSVLPVAGERLICLRNEEKRGLVNGLFLEVRDVRADDDVSFSAKVYNEDGQPIGAATKKGKARRQRIYRGPFDDHVEYVPDRRRADFRKTKNLIMADHGRAITTHKAQGSQWERVIVWDERLRGSAADYARWLYTAITRASNGLCIVSDE